MTDEHALWNNQEGQIYCAKLLHLFQKLSKNDNGCPAHDLYMQTLLTKALSVHNIFLALQQTLGEFHKKPVNMTASGRYSKLPSFRHFDQIVMMQMTF